MTKGKLRWAAVDFDNTLAWAVWPKEGIGQPIYENIAKVRELVDRGYKIVIHTSRPWTDYEMIENWLQLQGIEFRSIQCGKLLAAVYIDDHAINSRSESWIPEETYGKRT